MGGALPPCSPLRWHPLPALLDQVPPKLLGVVPEHPAVMPNLHTTTVSHVSVGDLNPLGMGGGISVGDADNPVAAWGLQPAGAMTTAPLLLWLVLSP